MHRLAALVERHHPREQELSVAGERSAGLEHQLRRRAAHPLEVSAHRSRDEPHVILDGERRFPGGRGRRHPQALGHALLRGGEAGHGGNREAPTHVQHLRLPAQAPVQLVEEGEDLSQEVAHPLRGAQRSSGVRVQPDQLQAPDGLGARERLERLAALDGNAELSRPTAGGRDAQPDARSLLELLGEADGGLELVGGVQVDQVDAAADRLLDRRLRLGGPVVDDLLRRHAQVQREPQLIGGDHLGPHAALVQQPQHAGDGVGLVRVADDVGNRPALLREERVEVLLELGGVHHVQRRPELLQQRMEREPFEAQAAAGLVLELPQGRWEPRAGLRQPSRDRPERALQRRLGDSLRHQVAFRARSAARRKSAVSFSGIARTSRMSTTYANASTRSREGPSASR